MAVNCKRYVGHGDIWARKGRTHVRTVVERAVLRNGDDHRLVVRRRVDRADAVSTRGDTSSDGHAQDTVNSSVIDTLRKQSKSKARTSVNENGP